MATVVIAIGGNSLTQSHQRGTIAEQYTNAAETADQVAQVIAEGWDVVLTHGNGPQVGNALRRVELSRDSVYPLPLDICVADTQGGIGYMLELVLDNALRRRGLERTIATFVTRTLVDANDPAFAHPDKPVGPFVSEQVAKERMKDPQVLFREDSARGWRRVVPSPKPLGILELRVIRNALEAGYVAIAAGGGGVPVVELNGELHGIEAVVDKDHASALLARALGAEALLMSTAVPNVQLNFGGPNARALHTATVSELEQYLADGQFAAGSMRPKVEAAMSFVSSGGTVAIIADPPHLADALAGRDGTRVISGE